MRWLRRYNENFGYKEFNQFRNLFKKVKLTPPVDKIHVSKLYKLLIIELDREVEFPIQSMFHLVLEIMYSI